MRIDLREIAEAFPAFRVGVVVATGMSIPAVRPAELDALIDERRAASRLAHGGRELAEVPGIPPWRLAYKAFGIKSTRYRCSVERLVKNTLADRPLPAINGFVDAYNAVSLTHVFPVGADDLDRVEGDIFFRYAREGDSFVDMSGGEDAAEGAGPAEDPPKPGEVVYTDAAKVLCRRWNWRQDARSLVCPSTTRAVLTVQSLGVGDLAAALSDVTTLIERFCGGRTAVTIAGADDPSKELAMP
ncbi:MAG: phenylalanine--tRNA ligase beta subunit-related protein [Siculibacillus sp.]|nr:phenylalanine--tRNA ligase beta subunit-related protein [Siculibacillus sp.]